MKEKNKWKETKDSLVKAAIKHLINTKKEITKITTRMSEHSENKTIKIKQYYIRYISLRRIKYIYISLRRIKYLHQWSISHSKETARRAILPQNLRVIKGWINLQLGEFKKKKALRMNSIECRSTWTKNAELKSCKKDWKHASFQEVNAQETGEQPCCKKGFD